MAGEISNGARVLFSVCHTCDSRWDLSGRPLAVRSITALPFVPTSDLPGYATITLGAATAGQARGAEAAQRVNRCTRGVPRESNSGRSVNGDKKPAIPPSATYRHRKAKLRRLADE
jgi:hypothetical protein